MRKRNPNLSDREKAIADVAGWIISTNYNPDRMADKHINEVVEIAQRVVDKVQEIEQDD